MNSEGTAGDTAQGAGLHRFLRSHKLHGTDEFSSVFAFRRVLRGQFYHLHYRPNGLDTARLGVVVAKKLARRANVRNLVKRIAREIFRRERAGLPACDLIARLQVSPAGVSRAQLNQDLRTLLTRLPRPSAPPPTSRASPPDTSDLST